MNKKRYIALALALTLLASFAGCAEAVRAPEETPEPTATGMPETPAPSDEASGDESKDYTYAFERFQPDDVVMTVSGIEITWREYFYNVLYPVSMLENALGPITDWDAPSVIDASVTTAELVDREVMTVLQRDGAVRARARDMGISLSDEDWVELEESVEANFDQMRAEGYDPDEALADAFLSKEDFLQIRSADFLRRNIFIEMYGELGEKCPDDEALAYIEESGIIYSKHILLMTMAEDESGNPIYDENGEITRIPEEELAERLTLMEDILAQIDAADDKFAKFDELMAEYTEDTGYLTNPNGYLFTGADNLDPVYRETMEALEPGTYSGIVESSFGYHIILRLELTPDTVTAESSLGAVTMRYDAAEQNFHKLLSTWMEEAEIVYTEKFKDVSYADIFTA